MLMVPVCICASGMVTAAGLSSPASLAAMRAGVRAVKQTNLWDAESGTYLAAGKAPLPQWWVGLGKLADLVAPAIHECLQAVSPVPPETIPVLLALPPHDRPFRTPDLDTHILSEIEYRLGHRLHPTSRILARDHVTIAVALEASADLIETGNVDSVIVAAVDSLLVHDLKNHYLAQRRLLTPLNSNGFSLGEAGSALLVTAAPAPDSLHVRAIALSREPAGIESEEPLRAEGLTQAIRDALRASGLAMDEIQCRITDLNGEHYKFKELALATGRFSRKPTPEPFDVWHPIESLGDVGAAIGPILLAIALDAGRKGYAPGPSWLCTLGNDDGERAALVLTYELSGEPS
jgi:3-oxoacyl-[acyl-carrier-protein] synthase-1